MKSLKKILFSAVAVSLAIFVTRVPAFALDITQVQAPEGFQALLTLVPIVLVLVLLFLRVDMIIAGVVSALVAMLIGGVPLQTLNSEMLGSIPQMLSNTGPIINSAVATAVFKAGGYTAAIELVKRLVKGKVEFVAAFIALLVSLATYMSGLGGGTVMVVAPLAFVAVGVVPELIASMSIAAAASFIASPASLETAVISQLASADPTVHVAAMRPYWILFTVVAVVLAFIGTKRSHVKTTSDIDEKYVQMKSGELFKYTIPALFLLFAVILGPVINKAINFPLFVPVVYMILTLVAIILFIGVKPNETFASLIEGSSFILTRLFQVGVFLGFIFTIAHTGTFSVITGIARSAPATILIPAMVLAGVLIGIPAGAYVGSILSLIIPVAIALGFSATQIGFVAMGVAFGSQMSFVNISMQALSSGFQIPILQVVKGNAKWLVASSVVLMGLSLFLS